MPVLEAQPLALTCQITSTGFSDVTPKSGASTVTLIQDCIQNLIVFLQWLGFVQQFSNVLEQLL